jgi:hypothetical protein
LTGRKSISASPQLSSIPLIPALSPPQGRHHAPT